MYSVILIHGSHRKISRKSAAPHHEMKFISHTIPLVLNSSVTRWRYPGSG